MSVAARQEKLLEKLNLDRLAHWSPENVAAVRELVLAYHDVFALESNELGCTSAIEHEIRIENSEPFKEWSQHIPPPLLEEVCTFLRDMLEAGAIHPSQSPWCNAVVLVWKKDGTLHFCVDFRCLNVWMKKDLYPLLHIQEALESMAGSVHFSSMDCKSGFWQIKMALELQKYTAFTVGNLRFYEFTCMPFRLCNAHTMFQHLMQNTLGKLNLTYCMIYLDDIIVFGCMEEEHLECHPSQVPQVAPSQEGHTTTTAGHPPQGVPWSGGQDRTGQDVLPYPQQSHPEQGSHVCKQNPKG